MLHCTSRNFFFSLTFHPTFHSHFLNIFFDYSVVAVFIARLSPSGRIGTRRNIEIRTRHAEHGDYVVGVKTTSAISIADELTCYNLLFRRDCLVALEEEVAECTRQRQVAVDAVELHPAASVVDAIHLLGIVRLVVAAERHKLTVSASDGARVTGVGTVKLVVFDENSDSRRAGHLLLDRFVVVHCRVALEESLEKSDS